MNAAVEIMTLPEVALLLRVADKTVYALLKRDGLPGFKVGGQWRFRRGEIATWVTERTKIRSARRTRPQRRKPGRRAK